VNLWSIHGLELGKEVTFHQDGDQGVNPMKIKIHIRMFCIKLADKLYLELEIPNPCMDEGSPQFFLM
jgi:hypothetical protein